MPDEGEHGAIRSLKGRILGHLETLSDAAERRRVDQLLRSLYEVSVSQDLAVDARIHTILELGAAFFGLSLAIVSRITGDTYHVAHAYAPGGEVAPGDSFALGDTYCLHTLAVNGPVGFHHVAASVLRERPCYSKFHLEAYLAVPLLIGGEPFGTLSFMRRKPRAEPFSDVERDILRLFAERIGNELARQRDVRNLELARREAEEQRQQAELANRAKSQFLAMMSHELRTPMTGVMGMIDLLLCGELSAEQRDHVAVLRKSADGLLKLLNDMLDFSKIEAGQLELEAIPFAPAEVLQECVQLFAEAASSKGLVLSADSDLGPDLVVEGDPTRLRQVISNLISNAIKFTTAGAISVGLREQSRQGDSVELVGEVKDSGAGMTSAEVARLFQPFSQADVSTTRRFGGTGLGLAISKRLVEALGGEIGVESVPERGSVFRFTVKVRVSEQALSSAVPNGSDILPDERGQCARKILVAEDNEVNRMLVTAMVRRMGHQVRGVANGRQAVAAVRDEGFDLVLMDMHMPVLDGREATLAIRALPGAAGWTPIVALTADAVHEHRSRYHGIGLTAFLTKPIDWQKLAAVIASLPAAGDAATSSAEGFDGYRVIDHGRLEAMAALIDRDSVSAMVASLEPEIGRLSREIRTAADQGEWQKTEALAHTLKGLCGNFGVERVAAVAHKIELRARQRAPVDALLSALDAARASSTPSLRALQTAGGDAHGPAA